MKRSEIDNRIEGTAGSEVTSLRCGCFQCRSRRMVIEWAQGRSAVRPPDDTIRAQVTLLAQEAGREAGAEQTQLRAERHWLRSRPSHPGRSRP